MTDDALRHISEQLRQIAGALHDRAVLLGEPLPALTPPAPEPSAALVEVIREEHRPVAYHWSQSGEPGTVCAASVTGLHPRVTRWPCSVESAIVAAQDRLAARATPPATGERCDHDPAARGWDYWCIAPCHATGACDGECDPECNRCPDPCPMCERPAPPATEPSAALVSALAMDLHATYCERSSVAMRRMTPQETAHQVEAFVLDRLNAIVATARAEGLDGAWAEVERALPEGRWLRLDQFSGWYCASHVDVNGLRPLDRSAAPTPVEALRNLAQALAARARRTGEGDR